MGSESSKDAGNKPWDLPAGIASLQKDMFEPTKYSSERIDPREVENAFSSITLDEPEKKPGRFDTRIQSEYAMPSPFLEDKHTVLNIFNR